MEDCHAIKKEKQEPTVMKHTNHYHLNYPPLTMFQMVERIAKQYPDSPAYEFYGKKTTYAKFIRLIEQAARAFVSFGIKRDDRVTICMPNTPQALVCFYAVSRIGAVANYNSGSDVSIHNVYALYDTHIQTYMNGAIGASKFSGNTIKFLF